MGVGGMDVVGGVAAFEEGARNGGTNVVCTVVCWPATAVVVVR